MGDAFAPSRVLRLTALMRLRGWLCRESLDSGGDFDEVPRLLLEPQHGFHVFFLHSFLSVSPWVFSWAWVKIPTRLFGSLLSQVLTLNEPFSKKILNTAHKAILTTSSLTHWVVRTTTGFVMILQKDSARRWILVSWLSKCKKESTHTVNQHFRESTWFAPIFDEWTRQKERRASIGVWKARVGRQHEISMSHIYTIGGGNSNIFYFHPGELIQFDLRIFFKWLGEPTTN